MDSRSRGKAPLKRKDDRVVIHFDYDCFYASVFEAENPALKSLPLAVQQKQIIVTCNYEARRRGLHKLQLIKEATKVCPDVVIVLGEDLTRFRNASKELYNFLRGFSWKGKVERLGFDEVFMDVTEIINYNLDVLNMNAIARSYFHLSKTDPTVGFEFDGSRFVGNTYPDLTPMDQIYDNKSLEALRLRLLLGSHLAQYLRHQLEEQKGYTSTVGVSTSKLLSKLVGNLNKPKGQTTLLPPYAADDQRVSNVTIFLDSHEIGKIPGIGFKMAQRIREHMLQRPAKYEDGLIYGGTKESVTVADVRQFPDVNAETLEKLLSGPGSPHGIGSKVWSLINGIDDTEVGQAREVSRQISIEDSYVRLDTMEEVMRELKMLALSLIKRMHTDLLEEDDDEAPASTDLAHGGQSDNIETDLPRKKWLAHPRTLRLSTRPRPPSNPDGSRTRNFNRISRSFPTPNFLFSLNENVEALAERLVTETLIPMFRKLHPEKSGWNLSLVNVAVTNMTDTASNSRAANGRDIGRMFRRQEDVLKEWKVEDRDVASDQPDYGNTDDVTPPRLDADTTWGKRQGSEDLLRPSQDSNVANDGEWDSDGETANEGSESVCATCGSTMPAFAMVAHNRFHYLGE